MSESPWTSDDPQPGDFDEILESIDPRFIETHPGNPNVTVRAVLDVDVEDLALLDRISARRGKDPRAVISELIRDAERSAA